MNARSNLSYLIGVLVMVGVFALGWWVQNYSSLQGADGVLQLSGFLYLLAIYGILLVVIAALGYRIRANLKYFVGILGLSGLGVITWYSEAYIAPQLGVFFGFVMAYIAAVFVLFYILGRYGG